MGQGVHYQLFDCLGLKIDMQMIKSNRQEITQLRGVRAFILKGYNAQEQNHKCTIALLAAARCKARFISRLLERR